jgi:outer membrane protein assembly factor BamB/plastocyanin
MNLTHTAVASSIAIALAAAPTIALGQSALSPAGNDWPQVTGNLGAQGYTGLTQINKANIKDLGLAWMTNLSAEPVTQPVAGPGGTATAQQTTPIVVEGVMYLNPPNGGVVALDAATGAVKWKWVPSATAPAPNNFGPSTQQRGVSVGEGKVYTTAAGNRVVALDKETGAMVWAVIPTADGTALGAAKVAPRYFDGLIFMGTNDNNRGAAYALRASNGALVWVFYGAYPHGTSFTDVNGTTFDAGDTWTTKVTPNDTPNNCYLSGGAAPWQQGTIDPELGMIYIPFGNVRSCNGSQNGEGRPGDNLFGSSVVALDYKTGAYKWHFQAVRHDIWDMDNALTPSLADVVIDGQTKKVLFYGSKSLSSSRSIAPTASRRFPSCTVQSRATRATPPRLTQPWPLQSIYSALCMVPQNLGSEIPGHPNRMAPNWNGYQAEPDPANPGQLRLVYKTTNYLSAQEPFMVGPPRQGCLYDGSYEGFVYLFPPSQNGGNDMTNVSVSPKAQHALRRALVHAGGAPAAARRQRPADDRRVPVGRHPRGQQFDGPGRLVQAAHARPVAPAQPGGHRDRPPVPHPDGWLRGWARRRHRRRGVALPDGCPEPGRHDLVHGQRRAVHRHHEHGGQPAVLAGRKWPVGICVEARGNGEVLHRHPRQSDLPERQSRSPRCLAHSQHPSPVDNTAAGIVPANEIWMARSNNTATSTGDSVLTASMIPSTRTVPVGTTVTFRNPGVETFPTAPNLKEHCATQFFEGKFNFRLQPGQTAQYTFDREGEYFYNDCTDPRPTGKVVVTLAAQDQPGATIFPSPLDLRSPTGIFTGVGGLLTVTFNAPAGYVLDKGPGSRITLTTPLTARLFDAVIASQAPNGMVKAAFNKADIDNNVAPGASVPLVFTANFMNAGVQKKLTSTINVQVMK